MKKDKKILLVEDQILVQGALATLLSLADGIGEVMKADNAIQALSILEKNKFDILITDIEMPQMSGLDLCQIAIKKYPEMKRVIITTFCRPGYIKRAVTDKIDGFILKSARSEDLINCISDVCQGKQVFDSKLLLTIMESNIETLTNNEYKALQLVDKGMSNKKIAEILFLSHGTVKNYISSCISKLGASNRVEAIRIAKRKGLL